MKYEKPELSIAESATPIVQGGFKGPEGPVDTLWELTIGA
jgi:hypothetical protein